MVTKPRRKKHELTSAQIAKVAAKGLRYPSLLTSDEIQAVCGSALTQVTHKCPRVDVTELSQKNRRANRA